MIAALYVETGGVYYGLADVDPWDVARDARLYQGPYPVVAHPPCARWCRLAGLVESLGGPRRGDDGGTFAAALTAVRTWGGVIEHPAWSAAWPHFGLPIPSRGGWQRGFCAGWVAHVEQANYGHPARKATWLYAFGVELPSLRWQPARDHQITRVVSTTRRFGALPEMSEGRRSRTPEPFRDVLLEMARSARRAGAA